MLQIKNTIFNKYRIKAVAAIGAVCLFFSQSLTSLAAPTTEERIAAQRALEIQSNQVENWPTGPVVTAESAILMEAETGTILYAKNIHQHQYPASTTKILTTLIASEQCSLDEVVTFSHDAVFGIPRGSNHIAMNEGDTLTMEQCLNAILIRSANEVSYAVAEHIGETWEGFAQMMNTRAKELGCVDSNFVNPNGLPDENHYTSAYDLAMIGRAFFANELLCKMTTTPALRLMKESGEYVDHNRMELLPGKKYAYDYLVGCKTGYTDAARSTLVSCAEKNGMKLICVVLKDETPAHYEDTIALFDYGFSNFDKVNVSQSETKYNIDNTGLFYSDNAIFGTSQPILSLNKQDCIILPKTVGFEDTVSTISYDTGNKNQAAIITYTYHDVYIGSASVDFTSNQEKSYTFDTEDEAEENVPKEETENKKPSFIFINIVKVLLGLIGIAAAVFFILLVRAFIKNHNFSFRNNRHSWKRNRRRHQNHYQSTSLSLQEKRRNQIRDAKRHYRARRRNRDWHTKK